MLKHTRVHNHIVTKAIATTCLIIVLALGTYAQGTQTSYITAIEYSHNGDLIAVGYGATAENPCGIGFADYSSFGVHILNRDLESQIQFLNECTVSDLAFSPADTELAIATYIGREIILDLQTGEPLQINANQGIPFIALTWSNSGAYIRATDRNILRRNVGSTTEAMPWYFEFHQELFSDIDLSPDDAYIVSSSLDGTAVIWAIADKQISLSYANHTAPIRSVDWSPVDNKIATGDESGQIDIWSSTTGQTLFAIQGHSGAITALEWSPDGTRLATASEDGTVKVWNSETGNLLESFTYSGPVYALDWDPASEQIIYGGADLSGNPPQIEIVDAPTITLIPTDTPTLIETPTNAPSTSAVSALAWSPSGEQLAIIYGTNKLSCTPGNLAPYEFRFDDNFNRPGTDTTVIRLRVRSR